MAFVFGFSIAAYSAVPKKVQNACKALATVVSYGADGKMLSTSIAFVVGDGSEAVSEYATFNRAYRAELSGASGGKQNVMRIKGASDIYDVVSFSVETAQKERLSMGKGNEKQGSAVYILRHGSKKGGEAVETKVEKIENVAGGKYYTLAVPYDDANVGCPVVNAEGEWVAVVQRNVGKDKATYAIGAEFCASLNVSETDYGNAALNSIHIPKLLPADEDKAYTYVYMQAQAGRDSLCLKASIDDFIAAWPNNSDGYLERAKLYAAEGKFQECEADISKAVSVAEKKDNPHYVLSRLIYQNALYNSAKAEPAGWTLEKSLSEAQEAYNINPMPLYQLQMGDCYFGMKRYADAVKMFSEVNHSGIASSETFFYEARAREKADSTDTQVLSLLDSAVARFAKPYSQAVAPYILERANQRANFGKYREATLDYLEYEHIVGFQNLNDNFYYIREQVALKGNMYKQADDDINRALAMRPDDYVYNAEKAALMLRVGQFEDAVLSAKRAIGIDPQASDAYRLLGIAYGEMKNKQLCLQNLRKAKELGDDHVDELIEQYK